MGRGWDSVILSTDAWGQGLNRNTNTAFLFFPNSSEVQGVGEVVWFFSLTASLAALGMHREGAGPALSRRGDRVTSRGPPQSRFFYDSNQNPQEMLNLAMPNIPRKCKIRTDYQDICKPEASDAIIWSSNTWTEAFAA